MAIHDSLHFFVQHVPCDHFHTSNLDFGSFVADDSRHRGERSELVSSDFGVHTSQVTQQSGLTH